MSSFLGEERDFSETLIRPLIMGTLSSLTSMEPVLASDFFLLRQRVYRDVDGVTKVALGVAFLQDHDAPDPDLDALLVREIFQGLRAHNLDLLVNDITVNLVQVRNGEFNSLL